jgi:hypothetical protein
MFHVERQNANSTNWKDCGRKESGAVYFMALCYK